MNVIKPTAHHIYVDDQDILFDDLDDDDFCFDDDCMSEEDYFLYEESSDSYNVHFNVIAPPRDVNPVSLVLSAPVFDDSDNDENVFDEIHDERLCSSTQFTNDLQDNEEDDDFFMFF
ncbi:Uncharacterized protein QTN25_010062 [Entamoeba marina]